MPDDVDTVYKKAANGNKEAQDLVLKECEPLVKYIVKRYRAYGLPQEDLMQEAYLGVLKALERFDDSRGEIEFKNFAAIYMKENIYEFVIRNIRIVRVIRTKAMRKLFFSFRSLKTKRKSNKYIADYLGVTLSEVQNIENFFATSDTGLMKMSDGVESDWIPDPNDFEEGVIDSIDAEKRDRILLDSLNELPERSKEIIQLRWLFDEKETHKDIGEAYGITTQRIQQIEATAMKSLKLSIANRIQL